MRRLLYSCLLCLAAVAARAQDEVKTAGISAVKISQKTYGQPKLSIDLKFDLKGAVIDNDYYLDPNNRPRVQVDYSGKSPKCALVTELAVTDSSFQVILSNLSEETVERIAAKDNKISITFTTDLRFRYQDLSVTPHGYKLAVVSQAEVNKKIKADLSFPADQQTKFITALNNFYYYKNNVDFGVQPAKDQVPTSYTLNFDFQNLYNTASLLKCNSTAETGKQLNRTLVYYGITSRLSTNAKDSLNFIDIYPLILRGSNYKAKVPTEWNIKAGHESSQDFSRRRVAVDASLSAIIPNLVDLTSASSERLRLKPVLDLGIKGYHNYSSGASAYNSGQAYLGIYYYIPVYDHYAIIINDKTFYDFSKQNNPKQLLASNYSVAVGTEIPKTGFKVMFKYQDGKSEFNQKETQTVVIGLIMNMFNESAAK